MKQSLLLKYVISDKYLWNLNRECLLKSIRLIISKCEIVVQCWENAFWKLWTLAKGYKDLLDCCLDFYLYLTFRPSPPYFSGKSQGIAPICHNFTLFPSLPTLAFYMFVQQIFLSIDNVLGSVLMYPGDIKLTTIHGAFTTLQEARSIETVKHDRCLWCGGGAVLVGMVRRGLTEKMLCVNLAKLQSQLFKHYSKCFCTSVLQMGLKSIISLV